jgi:small subunit ribosomal protein S9
LSDEKKKDEKAEVAPGADLEPIKIADDEGLDAEERARREADAEERARREAEATAEVVEPEPVARPAKQLESEVRVQGTGKRKNAVARVLITAGDGAVTVNGRSLESYFPRAAHQAIATQPLVATGYDSAVSVSVRVHGGGVSGQAGAVRHGIARALCEVDGELRGDLKRRGFLTRDARVKERRKAGLKKARKRPQFSKR